MVLYSKLNLDMTPPSLDDYTPSLGESAAAARDEAWATNPSASLYNMVEMYRATGPRATREYVDPVSGVAYRFEPEMNPDALSIEEQQIKIRDAGLEGVLKPQEGYTQWALNILFARKKAELSNQFISSRSPASHFPVTLGAGLAASVVDPINIASAFVPVVGESRALSLLGKAKGATGRALTRAKIGAIEGAVGGALVEPLIYTGQNAVQADYDMTDSLLNVGFGAVMGATLQPLAGGVGDWLRARRGQRQPWQLTPDTDESRALMLQFRDSIRDARIAMGVDATRATEEAAADAAIFDARARRASYDFNRPVKEYYDRWMPEVQAALSPAFESLNQHGNELPSRFADMPMIEADSSQWFGAGKAIDTDSRNMRKAVYDWSRTAFPQGTTVANADTGWGVQVTPSGIKSSLHHGYDELLARSVPFIPQIIENGIYLDSIEKKSGLMSHIFANKIRLDGQDYVVGFVLREDDNGNRFYDHELTEIISPDWLKPGRDTSEEALGHRTNRGISSDRLKPGPALQEGNVVHRTNRGDVMNILRDRLGVNDGTGQVLFQTAPASQESLAAVRSMYEGTDAWMKAPNGKPTKLKERQWLQVRTPEFKAWFGDWEADPASASKAIDENGEPLVVYHNTDATFDTFSREKIGSNYSYSGNPGLGGFFFSTKESPGYGKISMPVFLNIRNAVEMQSNDTFGSADVFDNNSFELLRRAFINEDDFLDDFLDEEMPANGIIIKSSPNFAVQGDLYVVSQPNQVKSAVANRGTFDTSDPRILFQFIDPSRVQATPGVPDVVPVLRRIFHMNTMELDDSKAVVTVPREIGMSGSLTDIYQHDALYELYPELRDVRYEVVPEDRLPGNLAGYSPKNGIIYITTDPEVTPSVIAHEVQHAIQDVDERFDFGLSEEASQEVYSQVEQELKDKLPLDRARALAARIQYLSQAHEIQAFDTQNRFELTAEERAKYAPNNPSTYYQRKPKDSSPTITMESPRARVNFDATPDGRAVIEFFSTADASSAPHELYHIFRREMAENAARPDAPQRVREDWARIEEFVGAEPGQTWTREMEEKFARAGERFLLEGKAPTPALQDVFERLRQWLLELYANADAAGLHISPAMREVFNNMFSVPAEEADASFRYAVGDLATREIEREFAGDDARIDTAVQEGDMETVGALAQDAEVNLNETLTIAAQSEPETAGMISEQYAPELAAADVDIVKVRQMRDVLRKVVACEMGR